MDPLTWGAIGTAGAGILGSLFQKEDPMLAKRRAFLDRLMKEYNQGDLGFSDLEKQTMSNQLKEGLEEQTGQAGAAINTSMARRGMGLSRGQMAGSMTDLKANEGKAYGQGIQDINLADAAESRRRRAELESLISGFDSGGYQDKAGAFSENMGDMSSNLFLASLLKQKKPGMGGDGYFSNLMPPRWRN